MTNLGEIIGAFLAGAALGIAFFGGLWLTVTRGLRSPMAGAWFLASNVLRTAVAVTGFYFMAKVGVPALSATLVGFLCSRLAVGRLVTFQSVPNRLAHRRRTSGSDRARTVGDGWFVPSREPIGEVKSPGGTNHPPATVPEGLGSICDPKQFEERV